MVPRRFWPALTVSLALLTAAPAAAQTSGAALVAPTDRQGEAEARLRLPEFRTPRGDLRDGGEAPRDGLIAAFRVSDDLQIGVGRFEVPDPARPRTHMERERNPTAVRPRDRGIAAIGFSLRF